MDSLNLTSSEKKIIHNRQAGNPFSELSGIQRSSFLDQIIARVTASTGCDLPQTDFFASILSEEMAGMLVDFEYDKLTLSEIIYAVRINSNPSELKLPSGIELAPVIFTGRSANTYFVSKVIGNYMILRNILDRKLQNYLDGY